MKTIILILITSFSVLAQVDTTKVDTTMVVFYPKPAQFKAIQQAFINAEQAEKQKWDLIFILMGETIVPSSFTWDGKKFIAKKAK